MSVDSFFVSMRAAFKKCFCLQATGGLCVGLGLQFFLATNSIAGPPLVTDDPGILDPGAWEVIMAIAGEDYPGGRDVQAPVLDVSLGLTSNTQLSVLLPNVIVKSNEGDTKSGLGHLSIAYKWRISSSSGWEWAIAPNYSLPVLKGTIPSVKPVQPRLLGLPLLASRTEGLWTWLGQVTWNLDSEGEKFWDYGVAVCHPLGQSMQWMMEFFGNANASFKDGTLNYNVGLDYEINKALHLLGSVGSQIKSGPERGDRINYSFYIGLQWFPQGLPVFTVNGAGPGKPINL